MSPLETWTFGNPVKVLWVDIALKPCTCRFGCKAPAIPGRRQLHHHRNGDRAVTRLRRLWARIRHLDQVLLDGYATLRLTPPRRKDTR